LNSSRVNPASSRPVTLLGDRHVLGKPAGCLTIRTRSRENFKSSCPLWLLVKVALDRFCGFAA